MMRAVDLIHAKRQGSALDAEEIRWLIDAYTRGRVPDYQMSAWLMAVFFRGLDDGKLAALTDAMMQSGEVFDLSAIDGPKVDKHSTGGVGDKVSLALAPLAAACGLVVPMVSGRGLGHTGGTLDKLESIPGFKVDLGGARFRRQLAKMGVSMIGQTRRFVPADKKLYALRDVSATVESIPLISASIMSKKMAEGAQGLVLDIKVGNGAFMTDLDQARQLGRTMIAIGQRMGRDVTAVLTDMNQPTGSAVGNANEVAEAIACLQGSGPADLRAITLALAAHMLKIGALAKDLRQGRSMAARAIEDGSALEKFRQIIEDQGGDPRVIDDPTRLPDAPREAVIEAPRDGVLKTIDTREIGRAACLLGAGRATLEEVIDPGVGLWMLARLGDRIEKGQPLVRVRYRQAARWNSARPVIEAALHTGERAVTPPPLFLTTLK